MTIGIRASPISFLDMYLHPGTKSGICLVCRCRSREHSHSSCIMDHEGVPCSFEYVIDRWTHIGGNTLVYIKKNKMERVTMEFEIPKWPICMPTLSIIMGQWPLQRERERERLFCYKRQGTMAEKCRSNIIIFICLFDFFGKCFHRYKERMEEGDKVKHAESSPNCPIGHS